MMGDDGYQKLGPNYEEDGKNGKGKKGKYYELVEYSALPSFMKDNEYILRYYRAQWPLKHLLLSIFTIHNETLNIWTHLLGFFLFLFLTIYTAMKAPRVVDLNLLRNSGFYNQVVSCLPSLPNMQHIKSFSDDLQPSLFANWSLVLKLLNNCLPDSFINMYHPNHSLLQGDNTREDAVSNAVVLQPITRWPFYAFMVGAMFCLLASTICHLISCHSERMSYIVHRFDYAGIAALIATSFYPPVYYSFMCNPFFCNLYLGVITVIGIVTMVFSLLPTFQRPEFRSFRASLFFGMGVSGVVPILHKMVLYGNQPEALQTTGYEVLMGVLYGLGALVYAKRVPERWMPGKFDIAGQSHQLFHILVVAAAFTHYQAGLVYLNWRDVNGC
ncbi:Heptahelical transmembrane protein ADIPOR3 [Linum grandiflorum]